MPVKKKRPTVNSGKSESKPKKVSAGSAKLDTVVAEINKRYGDGAVRIGLPNKNLLRVPTGLISLDIDLGGGVPVGRAMNIAGGFSVAKTTLALHILKAFQKSGYPCAFFDVEGTSGTEEYLTGIGVDVDSLLYSNPSSLEEVCNMILDIQKGGVFKFALWDCLIVTKPNKIVEKDVGDSVQMGVMQVILDEFFAKFAMNNNKLEREGQVPFTLITVNQLREKPTMYGNPEYCLHYDTKINFVDGRSIPIGEVVENKIEGEVWSYNELTNQFEPKPILDWKYNGKVQNKKDYLYIESNGIGTPNGKFGTTVTYNHELLTNSGWKEAQNLTLSDKLMTRYDSVVNGTTGDFLRGCFIGDSHIATVHKNSACLRFRDNGNPEYVQWKIKKLNSVFNFKSWNNGLYSTQPSVELKLIKDKLGNRDPMTMLSQYTDLSLAIWYCDDGNFDNSRNRYRASISVKRFASDKKKMNQIANALCEKGVKCKAGAYGRIEFNYEECNNLFSRIAKYIPPCMRYKLPDNAEPYEDFELTHETIQKSTFTDILLIRPASKRQLKKLGKYDISVGDNHNFLAGGTGNGVVVHNTPGGRAKDFAFSIDLRLRRAEFITEGKGNNKSVIGQVVSYKTEKNKTYKRYQEGQLDLYIEDNDLGIPKFNFDTFKSLVTEAVAFGLIEQGGAWYMLDVERGLKFQGFDKLVEYLREHSDEVESLEKKLLALVDNG